MQYCKPAKTPYSSGTVLIKCVKENCQEMVDVKNYQSIIGSLIYSARNNLSIQSKIKENR